MEVKQDSSCSLTNTALVKEIIVFQKESKWWPANSSVLEQQTTLPLFYFINKLMFLLIKKQNQLHISSNNPGIWAVKLFSQTIALWMQRRTLIMVKFKTNIETVQLYAIQVYGKLHTSVRMQTTLHLKPEWI